MSESEDEGMETINWWLDFFADAGIPPTSAAEYAVSFAEQRIPKEYEIILELGLEEWRELGVTILGDRLAMKTFAKCGKKKPALKTKKTKKTSKVEKQSSDEFINSFISKEKAKAKPVERQQVEEERVKSKNPFRKAAKEDQDDSSEVCYIKCDEPESFKSDVLFQVTMSGAKRKRSSNGNITSNEPKITRTIGAVQEDIVSSTSKVNITFNGMKKSVATIKSPTVSCSSFKTDSSKPEVRARLGKKNVRARLGKL